MSDVLKEKIVVEMSVKDALSTAIILSKANGDNYDIYVQLYDKLGAYGKYQECIDYAEDKIAFIDYNKIQKAVHNIFCGDRGVKKTLLLLDLESKVQDLLEQIKEIKNCHTTK